LERAAAETPPLAGFETRPGERRCERNGKRLAGWVEPKDVFHTDHVFLFARLKIDASLVDLSRAIKSEIG
jgi:hypothetical protein